MAVGRMPSIIIIALACCCCWTLPCGALQAVQLNLRKSESPYRQEMENHYDLFYTGKIKFGSQKIDAILDTGSFDLVVMSSRCDSCGVGLGGTDAYYRNKSSTYEEGDLIVVESYGSGDVYCQSGNDKLKIGDLETVVKQDFWEGVYADLNMGGDLGFDVILGIGPPNGIDIDEIKYMSEYAEEWADDFRDLGFDVPANYSGDALTRKMPNMTTVLENLNTTVFSVCLKRENGEPGYTIWNDDAHNLQSDLFQTVDVHGEHTWTTTMWNAEFPNASVGCKKGCGALIDSGTSLILLPTDTYTKLYDYLDSVEASCDNLAALPDLVFQLDGVNISLPPSSYIGYAEGYYGLHQRKRLENLFPFKANFGQKGDMVCTLLVGNFDEATQFGPMWILGTGFLREYYTTFDLGADFKNVDGRKFHLSAATDDCEPGSNQFLQTRKVRNTPMTVDISKIHVSRWVRAAVGKKNLVV